jgi:two-component system chemotaxis sensor kinase CheA
MAYREEAVDLLSELETALLELERTPDDTDLIGRVFRAMHTIKGSGAMFGFDEIASFTHDVETVYDGVRNGEIPVTESLIGLTLKACDQIRLMIDDEEDEAGKDTAQTEELVRSFRAMLKADTDPVGKKNIPDGLYPQKSAEEERQVTYRIRFAPAPGIFTCGNNPILLLGELHDLGKCTVVAHTDLIPSLDEIDPESCYTRWDVLLTTDKGINAVRDVFIFVENDCDLQIEIIDDGIMTDAGNRHKKLGEILVERGDLSAEDVQTILSAQKKVGELLVDQGFIEPVKVQAALAEQKHIQEVHQKRQPEIAANIRVPAEKLDSLVNMVGELVTVQSRLSQLSARINDLELTQLSEEVERLTAGLRDDTMSIRMLPIGTTFSKFQRLVRDLSSDLGKNIILRTEGAETKLDKTVIEKLGDPLIHLIRNCIDHGIEMPAVRKSLGKPEQGEVYLSAEHSGANVFIKISDDGSGLDTAAIRSKAIEKGLISADAVLSDKECFALIFAPGFSTAQTVTSVSGRGVGMDVVKKGIEALQGSIDITSRKGVGTTITLKLPLTLAIIDGLLVRIEDHHYIMPLSAIEECVELTREDVDKAHGKELADIRGEIVPYIRLRKEFDLCGTAPEIEQIVTARINGRRIGFVVDEVVGGHQTVIKSLGRIYRDVEDVSGATILGDGRVALILDLPKLLHSTEHKEMMKQAEAGY